MSSNYSKYFFIVILIAIGNAWALYLPCYAQKSDHEQVIDGGEFLNKDEKHTLSRQLDQYRKNSGINLILYTVPDLGGKTVEARGKEIAGSLGFYKAGLKISAMLLVAQKEKKLGIKSSTALEWQLPDTVTRFIKRAIVLSFRDGSFFEGMQKGLELMYEQARIPPWKIKYLDFEKTAENIETLNQIVLDSIVPVSKVVNKEKITEKQFDDDYFIYVQSPGGRLIKMHFSRNAVKAVDELIASGGGKIYGRVIKTNPMDVNFLGVGE